MNGSFAATFHWRWTPTAEDRFLSSLAASPHAPADASTTTADRVELAPGDWPGFRGPARDGRLSRRRDRHRLETVAAARAVAPPDRTRLVVVCRHRQSRLHARAARRRRTGRLLRRHDGRRAVGPSRRHPLQRGRGRPRPARHAHVRRRPDLCPRSQRTCSIAWTPPPARSRWSSDIVERLRRRSRHSGAFPARRSSCRASSRSLPAARSEKSVLGYKAKTGELAWSAGEGKLSYCSTQLAQLDGVEQLLIATEVGLTSFRPDTGRNPLGP